MNRRLFRLIALLGVAGCCWLTAAQAQAQTPIAYGETLAGELSVPGEFDNFTFLATAGSVIILRLADQDGGIEPRLRLLNPGGMELHDTYSYTVAELDEITLPVTGVYTVTASDHNNDDTGSYRLHLQRLDDPANATDLPLGATVAATLDQYAETQSFELTVAADDRIILRLSEVDSGLYPQLRVYDPDGAQISVQSGNPMAEIDALVIPSSGTHTVMVLDNPGTDVGEYRLHVQRLNDPVGAATIAYGQTLPGTIDDLAASTAFRLTASAGERVLLRLAETTAALQPVLRIYDPAGDLLTGLYDYDVAEINAYQLPVTGIYTVLALDHSGDETGNVSLHVQRTHDPAGAVALVLGDVHAGNFTAAGQTRAYTVDAEAGDRLLLRLGEVTSGIYPWLRVYDPSGQQIASQSGNPLAELNAMVVATTGTHTVLTMDNPGTNLGEYRLHCQCLNDPAAATAISYGQTLIGNLPDLTASSAFRLTAAAGDRILIRLAEQTAALEPILRLYDTAGDLLTGLYDYDVAEIDAYQVPSAGTYTVLALDHQGDETGDFAMHVQRTHGAAGATSIAFGETLPGTLTIEAQTLAFTFPAVADDRILLRLGELDSTLYPRLHVYGPGGQPIESGSGNPLAELNALAIPQTGDITVLVMDNPGVNLGEFRLHLQRLNDPVGAIPIAGGETVGGTVDDHVTTVAFSFTADAGDRVFVRLAELTAAMQPRLRVYDAIGEMIANLYDYDVVDMVALELADGGSYTALAMDHQGDEIGDVNLHLQWTHDAANATPIGFGETAAGSLAEAADTRAYTFTATAGDQILLRLGELASGLYPQLRIFGPTGEAISHGSGNPLCEIDPCEIADTGVHTVLAMDNPGTNPGEFRLHVQRLNAPGLAIPVIYTTVREDALDEIAQTNAYTFTATSADSITAVMTDLVTYLEPRLRLYAPDGVRLANIYDYNSAVLEYRLPGPGTYTLLAMDHQGDETGAYRFELNGIATAVPDLPDNITAFAFYGNHPNPFNPLTRFVFDLPDDLPVSLVIYGVDGRRVRELVGTVLPQGRHTVVWDGRDGSGRELSSGVYLSLLQAGEHRHTERLTLVR